MIVPLSQRMRNSDEVCARCERNDDGKCKLPVLMDMDKSTGRYHTAKLISFSKDGKECQLFKMSKDWWLNNVTRYDVLCPRCNMRFWDTYLGVGKEPRLELRVCRQCAEEVQKMNAGQTFRVREVKRCEYIVYDGTEKCDKELLKKDLYVQDGRLREMISLNACEDYGAIEVGDTIMLDDDVKMEKTG